MTGDDRDHDEDPGLEPPTPQDQSDAAYSKPERHNQWSASRDDPFPDPAEAARHIDPGPEDGVGVQRDTLMDARIDASEAAHALNEMYVILDGIADDLGLLPPEVNEAVRDLQKDMSRLAAWTGRYEDALSDQEEAARDG